MIGFALIISLAILEPATEQAKRPEPPKEIYRVWLHSVEEDTDKVEVYRPEDYAFPPARGREGFEMKQKGVFIAHQIGADDGVDKVDGKWECKEANVVSVTFPDARPKQHPAGAVIQPPDPRTLRILSCDKQALKLSKKKAGG